MYSTLARGGRYAYNVTKPYHQELLGNLENEGFHQAWPYLKKGNKWMKRKFYGAMSRMGPSNKKRRYNTRSTRTRRRRYKKRSEHPVKYLGEPKSSRIRAKRAVATETNGAVDLISRTQYKPEITTFPERAVVTRDDGGGIILEGRNNINNRERDAILWKGFQLHMSFINKTTAPLHIVCCILIPKKTNTVTANDFFMSDGGPAASVDDIRHRNFSPALTSLNMRTLPINTDDYAVFRRWNWILGGKPDTSNPDYATDKPNFKRIRKYFPINRKMTFDSPDDVTPNNGNMFVVYWAVPLGEGTDGTPVSGAYSVEEKIINYFRDSTA